MPINKSNEQYLDICNVSIAKCKKSPYFFHRGYPENQKRYRKTMVLGYAFPTMVSIGTLTAEYLAPKCASFRPRFGEEGCFFAG